MTRKRAPVCKGMLMLQVPYAQRIACGGWRVDVSAVAPVVVGINRVRQAP